MKCRYWASVIAWDQETLYRRRDTNAGSSIGLRQASVSCACASALQKYEEVGRYTAHIHQIITRCYIFSPVLYLHVMNLRWLIRSVRHGAINNITSERRSFFHARTVTDSWLIHAWKVGQYKTTYWVDIRNVTRKAALFDQAVDISTLFLKLHGKLFFT